MPRSPTKVTRSAPKRAAALLSCGENVLTSRRVAGEQLDRQRAPVDVAQEADHDLALARLAIPVVAEGGERVLLAFQISAGHVVEKHIRRRRRLSLSKQPGLDIRLMLRQPIQIGVEIVFVEADHAER